MVVTVDQAYAVGPNGVVETGPGSPFDLYSQQQMGNQSGNAVTLNNGNTYAANNSNLTAGQRYMAQNADVQQDAIGRAQAARLTGGDEYSQFLDNVALEHFNAYGQNEGRTWAAGAGFGGPPTGGATSTFQGGGNTSPTFAQPLFDTSQYDSAFQSAVGNFNGLLDNYNSFFGDMLTNATNTQNQQPQYGGGFLPFATTLMPGGGNSNMGYNPFNTTTGSSSGGNWNSGSNFGNAIGNNVGQAANSSHRQWFTL
jgi:hypothetical protein